ncbi:hypothetical protein, partial [Pseudomonas aeruginosa]|uniref:hypothetical protein n=1 Tax=Pseudomonas aeruginosa TaxID=287 RepID=UPI001FD46BF4
IYTAVDSSAASDVYKRQAHLSLSAKNHQCKKILEKGSFFRDLKREYLPEKMQNEYDKYSTEFNRLESECEQSMK